VAGKDDARLKEMVGPDESDRNSVCGSKGSLWGSSHSAGERRIVTRVRKRFHRDLLWERFLRDFLEEERPRSTKSQSFIRGTYAINQTNCLFPGDRCGGLALCFCESSLYIGTVNAPSTCIVGPFIPIDITLAVLETPKLLFFFHMQIPRWRSSLCQSRYLQGRSRVSRVTREAWKNSVFHHLLLCLLRTSGCPCYF
jgi:hypothetical protein